MDRPHPFTGLASVYAAARPHYSEAVASGVLEGIARPRLAVDVGCGTGLFTRVLVGGADVVIGLDLDIGMLAAAASADDEGVHWLAGRADHLPFRDGSAELVTCAQSFHWFADADGQAELHRVLRRGGRLALIWNVRRDETAFDRAYAAVARRAQEAAAATGRTVHAAREPRHLDPDRFVIERRFEVANPHRVDREQLAGRAESASYFPRDGRLRVELVATLDAAFDAYAHDGLVTLSQTTEVTLATRR